MCRRFYQFLILLFAGIAAAWNPLPAATSLSIDTVPNPPVEVSVESFLDSAPHCGFVPILVTLRNQTDKVQTFRLSYNVGSRDSSSTFSSDGSAVIEVGSRGRSQTYVYVPVLSRPGHNDIQINLSGPGIRNSSARVSYNGGNVNSTFIGMGDRSNVVYWRAIEKAMEERSKKSSSSGYWRSAELTGSKFSPASAPADWRAYVAFTSIWLSLSEWADLDPGARTAIAEWVGLGGNLYILAKDATQRSAFQIPGASTVAGSDTQYLGLGQITFVSDENQEAFIAKFLEILDKEVGMADLLQDRNTYRYSGNSKRGNYTGDWGLMEIVGQLEPKIGILSLFMILFVIVIGPVNFFVLAPSRRRYRILWTTPLIAFAASLILAGVILLSDGTGGSGARLTLNCLMPEQKRILVKQEQVSRTGLLLSDSFNFENDAFLMPIQMKWSSRDAGHLSQTATGWTGDWFFSRALQAQYASTVRTARGGVHVTMPGGGLDGSVMIALDTPFSEVYIIGDDGKTVYKATDLLPGVKRPLMASNEKDYGDWWKDAGAAAGTILKNNMETCAMRPGWFYAKVAKPGEIALTTLPSIQWTNDTALMTGPVVFERKK